MAVEIVSRKNWEVCGHADLVAVAKPEIYGIFRRRKEPSACYFVG
jgi:hypothetical protein